MHTHEAAAAGLPSLPSSDEPRVPNNVAAPPPPTFLESLSIVSGVRRTCGVDLAWDLLTPLDTSCAAPFVLLLHGFGGRKEMLLGHGHRLALAGAIVLLPNMASLLGATPTREGQSRTSAAQELNIACVCEHVAWATTRGFDMGLTVDTSRVALVGHSAGGAVVFEAALALEAAGRPPAAVVLLDGVPWHRTLDLAPRFPSRVALLSIRAGKSAWNRWGLMQHALAAVATAAKSVEPNLLDLLVRRSRHGDPIDSKGGCVKRAFMWALGLLGPRACSDVYSNLLEALAKDLVAWPKSKGYAPLHVRDLDGYNGVMRSITEGKGGTEVVHHLSRVREYVSV